jgi:hypothetical protein
MDEYLSFVSGWSSSLVKRGSRAQYSTLVVHTLLPIAKLAATLNKQVSNLLPRSDWALVHYFL